MNFLLILRYSKYVVALLLIVGIFVGLQAFLYTLGALVIASLLYVAYMIVSAGRGAFKTAKSLNAARGDAAAMSMEKDRVKSRLILLLGIPASIAAAVSVFTAAGDWGEGWPAAIAFFACLIPCLVWSRVVKARYSRNFKENIVRVELSKVFDNLLYEPRGRFDEASIRELDFFRECDAVGGNDLIDAEYRGIRFTQCDLSVLGRYTVTTTDSDGNTEEKIRHEDVFRGRANRFDFAGKFRGRVQVLTKDFDGSKVKSHRGEWQSVETELAEFNKYFDVFALDPLDAMAVLTPQMTEAVFYLKKAMPYPVALYFFGNTMSVFIATGREAFDVSEKKTLLEERELLKSDIALITTFMDAMYFGRQENAVSPVAVRAKRATGRIAGMAKRMTRTYFSRVVTAAFLASAVYGLICLPGDILAGVTYENGALTAPPDAPQVPTIGYLAVAGIFIVFPAMKNNYVISLVVMAIHLLFMAANTG